VVCSHYRLAQSIFRFSREQIDPPRLGVEVAGCCARHFNNFHQQMLWHWIGFERADRLTRTNYGLEDISSRSCSGFHTVVSQRIDTESWHSLERAKRAQRPPCDTTDTDSGSCVQQKVMSASMPDSATPTLQRSGNRAQRRRRVLSRLLRTRGCHRRRSPSLSSEIQ
jgi:hypothetical protein